MSKIILALLLTISTASAQPVWLVAPSPQPQPQPVNDDRIKFRVGAGLLAVGLAAFLTAIPLDIDGIGRSGSRGTLDLAAAFACFAAGGATAVAGAVYLSKYDH